MQKIWNVVPRNNTRALTQALQRHFSTSAIVPTSSKPEFRLYPFELEDVSKVMEEVPDVHYYAEDRYTTKNPFAHIGLDQPIFQPDEVKPPAMKPADLKFSRLENGLRIASVDRQGLSTTLELYINTGSRFETAANSGVTSMIQTMAFHSTAHLSYLRTIKTVETLGGNIECIGGRELITYRAECLRGYSPILIPLLIGNVLFPRLLRWEIGKNAAKLASVRTKIQNSPEDLVGELLHQTAWHNNTLGMRAYTNDKGQEYFNEDTIRNFMLDHSSPDRMLLSGVNIDHDELCKWAMRSFVEYNAVPSKERKVAKPIYTGGHFRGESHQPLCHVAMAYEFKGGWNSPDIVPITVLHALLGGGGSFSSGGPGKGMHSRLFKNVLSNHWVETCTCFNPQYSDAGLFGLYATCDPSYGRQLVNILSQEILKMGDVTEQELHRARNALIGNVYYNLENKNVLVEDFSKQLMMSGTYVTPETFAQCIKAVKTSDIQRVVKGLLESPPTVVVYGDVSNVPHEQEINDLLGWAKTKKA